MIMVVMETRNTSPANLSLHHSGCTWCISRSAPSKLRSAFRGFGAARAGCTSTWFRLRGDYEPFNDFAFAKVLIKLGIEVP